MVIRMNWVAAGLAATITIHALPAAAQNTEMPATLERWKAKAQKRLQRALVEPCPLGRANAEAGVVDVLFAVGVDGRATHVSVLHSSGQRTVDALALKAVRRIRTHATVPTGISGGQMVVARIYVAPAEGPLAEDDMRKLIVQTAARDNWATIDRSGAATKNVVRLAYTR
ncbi:TonB family protein [Sphingomonas montana]|uniref:TonB family protein n=1 Tax=Sphingomonas montana TaxID=1843236 RepID=UPI000970139F|nr:TonB family protein [Sphingomonas montana]